MIKAQFFMTQFVIVLNQGIQIQFKLKLVQSDTSSQSSFRNLWIFMEWQDVNRFPHFVGFNQLVC